MSMPVHTSLFKLLYTLHHVCMPGIEVVYVTPCVLCMQAYKAGVRYPQYVLIYPAWYEEMWWNDTKVDFDCPLEERESVIEQMLSIYQYELIEDRNKKADNGMVSA